MVILPAIEHVFARAKGGLIMSGQGLKQAVQRTAVILAGVSIMTFALVAGGWRAAQLLGGEKLQAAGSEAQVVEVVVSPGDTLWGLAVKHAAVGADPRDVIAQMRMVNELQAADIKPGMVLLIPVGRLRPVDGGH
jgi:hypothetical protein